MLQEHSTENHYDPGALAYLEETRAQRPRKITTSRSYRLNETKPPSSRCVVTRVSVHLPIKNIPRIQSTHLHFPLAVEEPPGWPRLGVSLGSPLVGCSFVRSFCEPHELA